MAVVPSRPRRVSRCACRSWPSGGRPRAAATLAAMESNERTKMISKIDSSGCARLASLTKDAAHAKVKAAPRMQARPLAHSSCSGQGLGCGWWGRRRGYVPMQDVASHPHRCAHLRPTAQAGGGGGGWLVTMLGRACRCARPVEQPLALVCIRLGHGSWRPTGRFRSSVGAFQGLAAFMHAFESKRVSRRQLCKCRTPDWAWGFGLLPLPPLPPAVPPPRSLQPSGHFRSSDRAPLKPTCRCSWL